MPAQARPVHGLWRGCRAARDRAGRQAERAAVPWTDDRAVAHASRVERPARVRAHAGQRVHEPEVLYERNAYAFDRDADRLALDELVHAARGVPRLVHDDWHLVIDPDALHEHEMSAEIAACRHCTETGRAEQRAANVVTATPRSPGRHLQRKGGAVGEHVRDAETARAV